MAGRMATRDFAPKLLQKEKLRGILQSITRQRTNFNRGRWIRQRWKVWSRRKRSIRWWCYPSTRLDLIKYPRFRREAQQFLKGQKRNSKVKRGIANEVQLASEIIGKSLGRLPFVTANGHLGLSSERIMQGDKIAIIAGSQVPFVLRPRDKDQFSVVSEGWWDRRNLKIRWCHLGMSVPSTYKQPESCSVLGSVF